MQIQLAVFDIAGTTIEDNNNVADAFQKAFAMNDIQVEKNVVGPLMGYHKPQAIQMVLEQSGHSFDAGFIEDIHDDFESEMTEFYAHSPLVRAMDGAEDIFRWLKGKGVRVALNTGFSAAVADVIVSRFGWEDKGLVDEFIGSDEVEKGRPFPYMIKELMRRCKITDPLQVAKIGDTPVDVEEGLMAGCGMVIAVTTGAGSNEELVRMNPTHIIHNLSQLRGII